jgi:hypothetical protein
VSRRLGAAACLALVSILPGCGGGGGGNSTIGEQALRDCLAQAGIGRQPPGNGTAGYAPVYLETAPDFTAYAHGASVDVVVQSSSASAQRTAAHARGALESIGVSAGAAAARVVSRSNAVAVFSQVPSGSDRAAVRDCMSG